MNPVVLCAAGDPDHKEVVSFNQSNEPNMMSGQNMKHQEVVNPQLQGYAKIRFNCETRQYVTSGHQAILRLLF